MRARRQREADAQRTAAGFDSAKVLEHAAAILRQVAVVVAEEEVVAAAARLRRARRAPELALP